MPSRIRAMVIFPKSREEWDKSVYFLFRAYVVIAFVSVEFLRMGWPRHGGIPENLILVVFGHFVCFFSLLYRGVVQLFTKQPEFNSLKKLTTEYSSQSASSKTDCDSNHKILEGLAKSLPFTVRARRCKLILELEMPGFSARYLSTVFL